MKILMLGNSFTYFNEMDQILAKLLDAEVVAHTRGGAYLAEQLDETTELGMRTAKALSEERWDYVVLQEYSTGPILEAELFFNSVKVLCEKIRKNGATPILYATWAYHEDAPQMADVGMKRDEMFDALYEAYHKAARENDALIADVGEAFREKSTSTELYDAQDRYHPNLEGSTLAAKVIAATIEDAIKNAPAAGSQARIIVSTLSYNNMMRVMDENGECHKPPIPDPVEKEYPVKKGDRVAGFEVLEITTNFVVLKSLLEYTEEGSSTPKTQFILEKGEWINLRMYGVYDAVEKISIKYV